VNINSLFNLWAISVNRSIVQLEHLAELYLSSTRVDEADKFYGFARAIDLNADTIAVTIGHVKQAVALACKDEGVLQSVCISGDLTQHD
jgi:hypothetical protein